MSHDQFINYPERELCRERKNACKRALHIFLSFSALAASCNLRLALPFYLVCRRAYNGD